MASANVDYYQRQKDLLDSMHENENRRRKLEAQLQAYFQSDQKLAKLRAVKLQSYWKKICEDEKRSKQRNSQLLRDLDRIEANMAGLEARREKIKHMKEQYFVYIEQTYPKWLELVQQKRAEQEKFEREKTQKAQQEAYRQHQANLQASYQLQQQQQQQQMYHHQQQQQVVQNQAPPQSQYTRDSRPYSGLTGSPRQQREEYGRHDKVYVNHETLKKEQEYLMEKQRNEQTIAAEQDREEEFKYEIPPPLPSQPPPTMPYTGGSDQPPPTMPYTGGSELQDREYTNLKNVSRQNQQGAPSQIVTVRVPSVDRDESGSPTKLRPDSGGSREPGHHWVPADKDTSVQSISVSDQDQEPVFSQPVQSVTVRQKSEPPKVMEPLSDDDVSDFGDNVDLPSVGDGPSPVKQGQSRVPYGEQRNQSPQQHDQLSDDDDDDVQVPVIVHPELSAPGLTSLLKHIEDEIGNALSVEGYYRSRNPDPSTRKDIIHKANTNLNLSTSDGEAVSMIVLEQLTPVIRRLPGACLLSDTLLVRNKDMLNQYVIRENLHRDAQEIWDKLLDHFMCLVKNRVMGTRELATVFVPCLVHMSSQHLDKAVSVLETIVESVYERTQGMTSPVQQDSTTIDTARSSQQGGVPPLKFGSLVDSKAFTDEESSQITQSMNTDGPKLPLNETEAYKNLLSGSMPASRPQVHNDDDTDENSENELEKQYISGLTPRSHASKPPSDPPIDPDSVAPDQDESPDQSADQEPYSEVGYIPTMVPEQSTVKSNLGSTGGSSQQRRLADKLGMNSDLDTDTEVDIGNMVTKKDDDDDEDFYDFYG